MPLRIGGKISPLSGDPVDLRRAPCKALHADMMMTGLAGTPTAMGDCALVETDGIEIVLITLRNQAMGTDLFTQLGCDLAAKKIVVVKSSQHFYASFSKVAKHVIYAGAPGAVTLDLNTLPYRKIRRPKWPLRLTPPTPIPAAAPRRLKEPSDDETTLACRRRRRRCSLPRCALAAAHAPRRRPRRCASSPHADLKILDPTFTTAYISRNFGYMVYDTLFAQDANGKPQAADGRQVHDLEGRQAVELHAAPGPEVQRRQRRHLGRLRRLAAALGRARQHRPRHDGRRRRVEGGRRDAPSR